MYLYHGTHALYYDNYIMYAQNLLSAAFMPHFNIHIAIKTVAMANPVKKYVPPLFLPVPPPPPDSVRQTSFAVM